MRELWISVRALVAFSVLTGVLYPVMVTGLAQTLLRDEANGSLIREQSTVRGSELVGQKFQEAKYFWGRPSAGDYNPLPSGGSNLGPISSDLKKIVEARRDRLMAAHPNKGEPPMDLLFASGSGLDPHISPAAAAYQIERVANARLLSDEGKGKLRDLVQDLTEGRQYGIFGEPRVNVLRLNMTLDRM